MESAKWNVKCTSDYQLWAFLEEFKSELKTNLSKQVLDVKKQQLFGQFGFVQNQATSGSVVLVFIMLPTLGWGTSQTSRRTSPWLAWQCRTFTETSAIFQRWSFVSIITIVVSIKIQEWQAVDNYTNGLVLADIIIKSIFVLLQHKWLNKKRYVCCERNVQICKKGSI